MKICIALGTRPEIIKLSSIISCLHMNKDDYFILHTGQHYSEKFDDIFFKELNIPAPKYNINVGSKSHARQTALILEKSEEILINEKVDLLLVQGDTNSVLGCALAASKIGIKIGHVEAGLRSYDRTMPEEINRIITDHISNFLFCPTNESRMNLINEGINEKKIYVTGNTIVDAVISYKNIAENTSNILNDLKLSNKSFFLFTIHRPANTNNSTSIGMISEILEKISNTFNKTIIFPAHYRTIQAFKNYNINLNSRIVLIDPVGYLDFLCLQANAQIIFTDSGGVQEEACIMKVPCITLRENTERPETVSVGANIITGLNLKSIINATEKMLLKELDYKIPFGNGKSGEEIIRILKDNLIGE